MKKQKIYKEILTKEEEQEIKKNLKENPITKEDRKAMYIAALIVFLPAALVVIGIFLFFIWLFFM